MTIFFKKVHRFNHDRMRIEEIAVPDDALDFNSYIQELVTDVIADPRARKYLFPSDQTAIKTTIAESFSEDSRTGSIESSANRLLRIETSVQGRIEHLNVEIQKGILIHSLIEHDGRKLFLIVKAEHADFINEINNRRATGLPIKKKVFKAFCAQLTEDGTPVHAMVSDYRVTISTYWWSEFLELAEEYTDEYNTESAFEALDRRVFNKIKNDFPKDYMYLRNATIQYFRSKEEFVMDDYLGTIIRPYVPEEDGLDIQSWSIKIEDLPEKAKFDSRFGIVREKLKKRIIKRLALTDQLELVIKENINWQSSVKAFVEDGLKYIKIRTDEGYKYFKED